MLKECRWCRVPRIEVTTLWVRRGDEMGFSGVQPVPLTGSMGMQMQVEPWEEFEEAHRTRRSFLHTLGLCNHRTVDPDTVRYT